ncbi:Zinc finger protein [Plakobranchus ocellatus]|uniref:Zinc finger protein n=1 Tax=Plakobranchus ocellatus TaxID=259542 RepID=A0AAV4A9B3_9GAST|nr:Zinc finger protein [Plakobranchus ocellatus]
MGDKILLLLLTESNKLLMQWKGPFDVLAPVGNDYRIYVNGNRKTIHAKLLRRYITRDIANDETPTGDGSVPAATLAVVEDGDDSCGYDAFSCEVLPKLGAWGSEETVKDLKFDDELSTDVNRRTSHTFSPLLSVTSLVRQY